MPSKTLNSIGSIAGLSLGAVGLLFVGVWAISGILTTVVGIGVLVNVSWFGAFGSFLGFEVVLAEWYATVAFIFFITAIIMALGLTLIGFPPAIILVAPFLAFVYFAVTGSIEIIEEIVVNEGLGEFGKPFLRGLVYTGVGLSALSIIGGDD